MPAFWSHYINANLARWMHHLKRQYPPGFYPGSFSGYGTGSWSYSIKTCTRAATWIGSHDLLDKRLGDCGEDRRHCQSRIVKSNHKVFACPYISMTGCNRVYSWDQKKCLIDHWGPANVKNTITNIISLNSNVRVSAWASAKIGTLSSVMRNSPESTEISASIQPCFIMKG